MNPWRVVLGLVAGVLGVAAAVAGLWTGEVRWFVPAAACSLAAGMLSLFTAERLNEVGLQADEVEERAERSRAESEQMAARAARFEAEAIAARTTLAESMRAQALAAPRSSPQSGQHDGVTDPATGLFNEAFFLSTLDKRVAAARRGLRPLAVIRLEVTDLSTHEPPPPKVVAQALLDTLRDADTACRLDDGTFGLVLEDTPENGAVWTAERFRRCINERAPGCTLWAGVACYPAHAFGATQILERASLALELARQWHQDRTEVALPGDD